MLGRGLSRSVAGLAVTAAVLVGGAGLARASCVGSRDPEGDFEKALRTSPVVFVGTVLDTQNQGRTAIVRVEEVWRGPALPQQVVVNGAPALRANAFSSVDRYFGSGTRYLFLPEGTQSPLTDNSCSFTRELTAEVERLRPSAATGPVRPVGEGGSGFPIWPIALGTGPALVAALLALRRRRSRAALAA